MPDKSKSKDKGIASLFGKLGKSKSEYVEKYSNTSYSNEKLKTKHRSFTDKLTRSGAETTGRTILNAKTLGAHEGLSLLSKTGSTTRAASDVYRRTNKADAINEVLTKRGDSERYAPNRKMSLFKGGIDSIAGRKTTDAVSNTASRHVEVSHWSTQSRKARAKARL